MVACCVHVFICHAIYWFNSEGKILEIYAFMLLSKPLFHGGEFIFGTKNPLQKVGILSTFFASKFFAI